MTSHDLSPIASQYDSDPWVPNIDPDSDGQDDQKKAAESYSDVYGVSATKNSDQGDSTPPAEAVTMPILGTAYNVAPDFVPGDSGGGSGGAMPTLPDSNPVMIDLGTLRAAEQTWVDECAIATEAYNDMQSKVWDAINDANLFGQLDGHHDATRAGYTWEADPLADSGKQFADAINPQLTQIMQDAAGAIELMGTFTALLNNAGQTYAEADAQSAFPDLGPQAK
ncbi:MAG: hypothetical protein HOY79_15320 [Streptomyces sp.]|nr:hypothetical protein [Streptomyces sp.]